MQEQSVFQETSELDQDLKIDGVVARVILFRMGKDRDSTKFFLHERPEWSKQEKRKMQIYGGSNANFTKLIEKSEADEIPPKKTLKEVLALKDVSFDGTPVEKPETTAHRELKEELRLKDQKIEYMGASVFNNWLNYYYFSPRKRARQIKDKSGQTHTKNDPNGEPLRHGWFTLKEINDPSFGMAFNHREVLNQAYDFLRDLQRSRENN